MQHCTVLPFVQPLPASALVSGEQPPITHGRVESLGENHSLVRLQDGRLVEARLAYGCLTPPQAGDMVLTYVASRKQAFVLGVLESARTQRALETTEELVLKAPRLRLEGGANLSLQAPELDLTGARARVGFLHLDLTLSRLTARIAQMGAFVDSMRIKARSLIQDLHQSLRRVRDMDTTHCAQMRITVQDAYRLKTGTANLQAEGKLSMDGKRVDIG
ncbi:hypothetical protein Thiowin_02282 [Thiorhodovibrio winogradskyi]|uniref:DUF3540 domain-containing protein n=1 Tax=Thiorhodovibrio winogradskyi TaxID=77007 RepID=A0ABZ0S8F7_9GAMM|nr:DUF3540 domain-containing protein [Thiorhodovibrio winogradskyi]